MIKLTVDNFQKAGRSIMTDPRCTDEVKAAVRRATGGEVVNGFIAYHEGAARMEKNTWFDDIAISLKS